MRVQSSRAGESERRREGGRDAGRRGWVSPNPRPAKFLMALTTAWNNLLRLGRKCCRYACWHHTFRNLMASSKAVFLAAQCCLTCWNLTCGRCAKLAMSKKRGPPYGYQHTTWPSKIRFDHKIILSYKRQMSFGVWTLNTSSISCRQSHRAHADESTSSYQGITFFALPPPLRPKNSLFNSHCTWVGQQVFWSQLYYIVVSVKWKHGKWERVEGGSCREGVGL